MSEKVFKVYKFIVHKVQLSFSATCQNIMLQHKAFTLQGMCTIKGITTRDWALTCKSWEVEEFIRIISFRV